MPEPLQTATPGTGVKTMPTLATRPVSANIGRAAKFRDFADLLDSQGADGFRARAYRRAADVVSRLQRPMGEILVKEGRDGPVRGHRNTWPENAWSGGGKTNSN